MGGGPRCHLLQGGSIVLWNVGDLSQHLHGDTTQKTPTWIFATVKTSDLLHLHRLILSPACYSYFYFNCRLLLQDFLLLLERETKFHTHTKQQVWCISYRLYVLGGKVNVLNWMVASISQIHCDLHVVISIIWFLTAVSKCHKRHSVLLSNGV